MSASFFPMKSKANTNKRKPQPANQLSDEAACDPCTNPRRSIPVGEVNQMIHRAVERVKAGLTIYDDRSTILERLESNEGEAEYFEARLHQLRLDNKTIRAELARVNLAITRQLELDGE